MYETERELNQFDGATLRIERGPKWRNPGYMHGSFAPGIDAQAQQEFLDSVNQIHARRGGGTLPVLAQGDPPLMISATELPVGKRVKVIGTMEVGGIYDPTPDGQTRVSRIQNDAPSIEANEHAIIVERIIILGRK